MASPAGSEVEDEVVETTRGRRAGSVAEAPARPPDLGAAWPELRQARAALAKGAPRVILEGLWGSSTALALTGLLGTELAALVLVADQAAQGRVVDDLRAFAELTGTRSREGVAAVPSPHAALWRGGAEREEEAVGLR